MSWVKKKFSKKNKNQKIKRQKVVKFMKRKSPCTCQSYSHSSRSAKQISESFSTNGHQNKKLCTLENWRLNCFFSKKSTFVTERSVKGMIFRIFTAKILYAKQKKFEKIIFTQANKIYIRSTPYLERLSTKVVPS